MYPSMLFKVYETPKEKLQRIALRLALVNPTMFEELSHDAYEGIVFSFHHDGGNRAEYHIPIAVIEDIRYLGPPKKLEAIKRLRANTSLDLYAAKCLYELLAIEGYIEYDVRYDTKAHENAKLVSVHPMIKKVR